MTVHGASKRECSPKASKHYRRPDAFTALYGGRAMLVMVSLVVFFGATAPCSIAQSPASEWSLRSPVFTGYELWRPVLTGDAHGRLHLLFEGKSSESETQRAIYYALWDGQKWSTPIDVIVASSDGSARLPSAVVDALGYLHVLWTDQQVYHSMVWAGDAQDAHKWHAAQQISFQHGTQYPVGLCAGDSGDLYAVYSDIAGEVYLVCSMDGGVTWEEELAISRTNTGFATTDPQVVAMNDTLYVVWARAPLPEGYPPNAVLFSRSTDNGQSWSTEQELAGINYGEPYILVGGDGMVHVVYNGRAGTGGKYYTWSSDDGYTWSSPEILVTPGTGGLNGNAWLAEDNSGIVHFVGSTGPTIPYRQLDRGTWSPEVDLRQRPEADSYSEHASFAVVRGSEAHVVYRELYSTLWHTWRRLDASPSPTLTYVEPDATGSVSSTPTLAIDKPPTVDGIVDYGLEPAEAGSGNETLRILALAAMAGIILFLIGSTLSRLVR